MGPEDSQFGKEDRKREHEENSEVDREEASQEAREPPTAGDWRRKREVQEAPACRDRPSPTVPNQGTPPLCHQPTPRPMLSLPQLDSQAHVTPDPGPEMRPRKRGVVSLEER